MQTPSTAPKVLAPSFLSDEQLVNICEIANVIACECPAYLVSLLQEVRKFRHYTAECVEMFPEDEANHLWLGSQAVKIENLLSQIILEFMQRENLLDESDQLNLDALARRNHLAALREMSCKSAVA